MQKIGSILDYSYPFLDPAVWDQDRKLFAYQKDFVLRLITTMYETYSLKQPEAWVEDVVILGSLTTSKWLLTSDMDVHIRVNLDVFIASNMPGSTKEQAFEKLDLTRKEFDRAKILAPMTQHPIEFYFESIEFKPSNIALVGVYSMLKDIWLKEPITFDADLDFEESKKDVVAQAEALAEELDGSLGKIKRNIQRVDELEAVIQAWGKDKQQLFYSKVEQKLQSIEQEILKDLKIKQDLVDARHADQNATSDIEIKFKWLARFGFFGILSNLKTLLEQTGGQITTQELPLIEKIINESSLNKLSYDKKYWISPDGKIYPFEPHREHTQWMAKKFPDGPPGDADWIRASTDGSYINVEVEDLHAIPLYVDNFIISVGNGYPNVLISSYRFMNGGDSSVVVNYDDAIENGIQKAVNKALQRKRMGSVKEAFLKEAFEKETDTQIAIDFDGTIAKDKKFPDIGEPEDGVKEALLKIKEMGYDILIYTCRSKDKEELEVVREYLDKHEIPYDSIFEGEKPFAKFYIDDRAIHFDNWTNVLKKVEKSEKKASSSVLKIEPYGGGVEFPVIINPSRQQIIRLLPQSEFGELRVIEGNNTYVWDASKATHDHVLEYLAGQGLEEYSNAQTGYVLDSSDIDEFSWKKASLVVSSISDKFWIDPTGKVYKVEGRNGWEDVVGHLAWIEANPRLIAENLFVMGDMDQTADNMISNGWTRITNETGIDFDAEVSDLMHLPSYLDNFVAQHFEGNGIGIDDLDGNYVKITDPFPNLQKAVVKELRNPVHASLKKDAYSSIGTNKYWITPDQKIIKIGQSEMHIDWVMHHLQQLANMGVDVEDLSAPFAFYKGTYFDDLDGGEQNTLERIMNGMQLNGWVRITSDDARTQFTIDGGKMGFGPGVDQFVAEHFNPNDERPIGAHWKGGDYLEISNPFPTLMKAYQKALKHGKYASKVFSKKELIAQTKKVKQGDYSCLMALVPHDLAQEIVEFGVRTVPDDKLYLDEDGKLGRELESHITIKYGLLTNDAKDVRRSFNNEKPFKAKLGKVKHFQPPELPFDVLTVEIISEDLEKANKKICDNFECAKGLVSDEYHPHITIAYMKRDTAKEYIGSDIFDGKEVELDTVIFSPHKGNRTYFSISNDKESSFILEEINKIASLDAKYWIAPDGNEFQVDELTHMDWIVDHLKILKGYGIDTGTIQNMILELPEDQYPLEADNVSYAIHGLFSEMLETGWTRITDDEITSGAGYGIHVNNLRQIPPSVDNFIAKHSPEGSMYVEDGSVNVEIDDPFPSIQKAVNKALSHKRLQPVSKKASMDVGYWVSPKGEVWDVHGEGLTHNEWILAHLGDLRNEGFKISPQLDQDALEYFKAMETGEEDNFDPPYADDLWGQMIRAGWVRVGDADDGIGLEVNDIRNIPSFVEGILSQDLHNGYWVRVDDSKHNSVAIQYPFKNLQKSVNQALANPAKVAFLGKKGYEEFTGQAFRGQSLGGFPKGTTAADVINYEAKELSNENNVNPAVIPFLKNYPAENLIWVTKRKEDAEQYGNPQPIDLGPNAVIVGHDEVGGYLVLRNFDINKIAEFLPSLFNAPDNRWQFEHGGDDKEIALNPDSVSDETTWYAPCTEGKPRTKEVWRQFISMFQNPFSKKEDMTIDSAYDPELEEAEKNALGEDETLLEYSKGFYDPKKHDFPHNTTWDSLTQDGEPSKPTSVTYSPQISNEDNLDQNSPGGYPRRFMGKPKGEWFSNEGEVNHFLIDMLENKAAALQSMTRDITASIEEVNGIKILVNPSPQEVLGFWKKSSNKALRALIDPQTGDIFAWDAWQSEHEAFIRYYGLDIDWENDDGTYIRHVSNPADINYLFEVQAELRNKLARRKRKASIEKVNDIPVFVNPTEQELKNYAPKLRGAHMFRGVIDPHTKDLFVWDAYLAVHWDMIPALGLDVVYSVESPYCLYFPPSSIAYTVNEERKDLEWSEKLKSTAGDQSASVPDYLINEWKTEQINNDTDEEPYVNHDQRDYPYGMHDSPENTAFNIGWAKDNTPYVVRLDILENPAYRSDPFGIGEYNVTWYTSLPASDGIEATNPE